MDDSLKQLEAQLENLVPRAQSEQGRANCHQLLDELSGNHTGSATESTIGLSWRAAAAAAAVALSLGLGGGWFLSQDEQGPSLSGLDDSELTIAGDFYQLELESWMISGSAPGVYVAKNGQVREILQETEVTKEVVKHRESGTVITVETTDHHLIDSVKSEF